MQKHLLTVVLSFSAVMIAILLGANIAYRTNTIPALRADFARERDDMHDQQQAQEQYIATLQDELTVARDKQHEAEQKLSVKLAEEERIAQEQAQRAQAARIAAQQAAAAEAARLAAAEKKAKASKKSRAS